MPASKAVAKTEDVEASKIIENIVLKGDLSGLTPSQRTKYYNDFCKSLGLNPLTQPFKLISFQGKMSLYATKDCTEQLRKLHKVSITDTKVEKVGDELYTVIAYAEDDKGKKDTDIGAVNVANLKGEALANAMMKAHTKAKRRVTLSICGLGVLDESELDTMPEHKVTPVEETKTPEPEAAEGEVVEPEKPLTAKEMAEKKEQSELAPEIQAGIDHEKNEAVQQETPGNKEPLPWEKDKAENPELASQEQRRMFFSVAEKIGLDGETAKGIAKEKYNLESFTQITTAQLTPLIDEINESLKDGEDTAPATSKQKIDISSLMHRGLIPKDFSSIQKLTAKQARELLASASQ